MMMQIHQLWMQQLTDLLQVDFFSLKTILWVTLPQKKHADRNLL